jgi:hypothetical protein
LTFCFVVPFLFGLLDLLIELGHIAIGLGLGLIATDNFEDLLRICLGRLDRGPIMFALGHKRTLRQEMKEADCEDEAASKADKRYWDSSTRPLRQK